MAILKASTVNGLRFGRGNNACFTNTAFGLNALNSISSGGSNTGFGFSSLNSISTGANNTSFGATTNGTGNNSNTTAIGRLAGHNIGGYAGGTHIGAQAGRFAGHCTVTAGHQAGYYSGNYAVSVGNRAGVSNGAKGVAVGHRAKENGSPANLVAVGAQAGKNNTNGANSTLAGHYTARYSGNAYNNTLVGFYSYQFGGYGVNNQGTLGRGQNTICNCVWRAWSNASDSRDKTNIEPITNLGLNFIRKLNPIKYRWDSRQVYVDECGYEYGVKDGTLKQDKTHYGFLAQELEFAALSAGERFDGITYDSFVDKYTVNHLEMIASLTKALQEINDDLDLIETQLNP